MGDFDREQGVVAAEPGRADRALAEAEGAPDLE